MRKRHKKNRVIKYINVYICIIILMLTILPVPDTVHAETPEQGKIIVSLGDSYSSGEGIEKFYGQDEDISKKIENPDWLAHRSENSWPGMLTLESVDGPMSKHRGTNWYFAAASGAKTKHMKKSQSQEYDRDGYSAYGDAAPLLDAQINIFDEMEGQKADYVTLTLGGNDAGFQNIIVSGAMKSSYLCNDLPDLINTTWEEFEKEGGIRDDLRQAYEDIAEAAGKQATVIVAGYPCLLDHDGIGAFYSKDEAGIINDAVHNFNLAIEEIVESCENSDINICFVSVEEGFAGHEAYAKEPYINEIMLSQPEDLKRNKKASIMNAFSAYSIHPNMEGAKIYAECVQKKINELERGKGKPSDVEESPVSEEQSSKEDETRALFEEKLAGLVEEYGIFKTTQNGTMTAYNDQWFDPTGIMGVTIMDFDSDGSDEMLVCVSETCTHDIYAGLGYNHIMLYMYENENGEIVQSDAKLFGGYNENYEMQNCINEVTLYKSLSQENCIAANVVTVNGKKYIMCERNCLYRAFVDGKIQDYWMLEYINNRFQYVCCYTQAEEGSSEFGFIGYTFENGVCSESNLYYSEVYESGSLYHHFGQAITAFFDDYGILLQNNIKECETGYAGFTSVLAPENDKITVFELSNIMTADDSWQEFNFSATLSRDNDLLESVNK